MKTIHLIFPHQLFEKTTLLESSYPFYLIEEFLFFRQYKFHKQKLAYQRSSMRFYFEFLKKKGKQVVYVESFEENADIRKLVPYLAEQGTQKIIYHDLADDWLLKHLEKASNKSGITLVEEKSPTFLNTKEELGNFFNPGKSRFFHTEFYIAERKKHGILIEGDNKPVGGKWSFDADNRKKYPKGKKAPEIPALQGNKYYNEAWEYVIKNYSDNPGELAHNPVYPNTFTDSKIWLNKFLEERLDEFGSYEDAIVADEHFLNHSVLTPMLNNGLLTPQFLVDQILEKFKGSNIPINSVEGFIRQMIGWREFIRGIYMAVGAKERTMNYWGFSRKIPESFYTGNTGISPVDLTIKKVLKTGYCHHIERLMVLGNFMLLCELDPDEVYRWFMELFIDAYDWVMVPNVYGMSQFSDGGLMATKPYISGSNYLMKMSNYEKGPWQQVWDGLFWRFMHKHREFFLSNPRLGMLVRTFDKMEKGKQETHLTYAAQYLQSLDE
jgi:deoxyribodipyrimidine photolyase-related protein